MKKTHSLSTLVRTSCLPLLVSSCIPGAFGAVTPGGTFTDKAIITQSAGGAQIADPGADGVTGTALVHDFDTVVVADPTYEVLSPSTIAASSGRHLVMYSTRFDATGGQRAEIQSLIKVNGTELAVGRSQGFIRQSGGANQAIMSGGAIIDVAADDDVLTFESARTDNETAPTVTRVANFTSAHLLKLDDTWDYLSLERGANQGGTVGVSAVDVTYDTNNSAGTMGTAFTFATTSGNITLNESGLYLVFANTGISKANNVTRTNFTQSLTLDGAVVPGSTTTTYVRGDQDAADCNDGMAAVGMILSATAGQVLNVEVTMESGGSVGTIKGGQTAISMVKLPPSAKYIEVTDTTNQNVVNGTATAIGFNTLSSPANSEFSHAGGTSVTVTDAGDYLFLNSLFTQSDAANDNHDRIIPLTRWQVAGSPIDRGHGGAYNRDNGGNRLGGSWSGTLLSLAASDTVEVTSQNLGTAVPSIAGLSNVPTMQGLSIASLIPSNDPAIAVNLPITVLPNSVGTVIDDNVLDTFDNDTPATGLTYTVDTAPAGGILRNNGAALGVFDTFTQDDLDSGLVTFDAGASEITGGFDFTVSDGVASDSSSFVITVQYPTTTVTIADDGDVTEGGVSDFVFTADVAPVGANATVTIVYSGSATSGDDFTGATTIDILDGQTSATLNVTTLTDGLFEGTESITATIVDVSGATITGAIGSPSSATFLVEDGPNSAPTGTNLTQVISGVGNVPIGDIVVTDADKGASSTVTGTAGEPLFLTNGIANLTVYSDGRADASSSHDVDATGPALNEAAGFSIDLEFIPQAGDLVGTVPIWEIGGSSNGSAILLVNGVPHLLSKANGGAGNAPTDDTTVPGAFNDLNWEPDNTVVVPLNGATVLNAGQPACIAVVFDIAGNQVKSSVNGSAEVVTALSPQSGTNFRGDHTVNFLNAGSGTGGNTNAAGNTFTDVDLKNLANGNSAVSSARFWNESGGNATGVAGTGDVVTATLTISGWSSVANGTLTVASGNGESFVAGVWSVTGTTDVVNAALAATEFVTGGSTADPTVINVSIEDGDEDGGGALAGTIIYTPTAPDPIYVDDDFAGNIGDPVVDADLGAAGNQGATIGLSAFNNLAGALGAVQPTGTIIVNDGDYSSENIVIGDTVTLQLTDTAGPVQIGGLGAASTNSIVLQGSNTLEVGAANIQGPGIDAVISGTGNFTKSGTARLVIRGVNTYTGTTTVNSGWLRVGMVGGVIQGELAGDGPVVVTDPGRLELNVDLDKTINQTGAISGTGSVGVLGDGTVIFDGAGPNTFSGGFELGDGATSSFDGIDQGAKNGFVVVNHSDHLGTGLVLSRGAQLQAGTPGLVIPNDVDITQGGFRCGGSVDFELSGNINPIDNSTRGYGNYGLEGVDLTISGNITMTSAGTNVNFEGVNNKDNGTWTINGDISGPANLLVQNSFDGGVVTFNGTHTYTGTTICQDGTTTIFNATQTGGGNLTVQNGAIMSGSGSTDSTVTVEGTAVLSPGGSPGTFTTGNFVLNGTLEVEANNNTPGTGYDQVVVNGSVTLGAASSLVIVPGGGLTAGELVIISNDAADGVTGNFNGLFEGAAVDDSDLGLDGTITYTGGDANDVAITLLGYSPIGQWRVTYYGNPSNSGAGANGQAASNGLNNLQSFALDLDPTTPAPGLVVDTGAGTITSLGPPQIWIDPADGKAYLRRTQRTDFAAIPLTITDQFSRALTGFEDSPTSPVVIATGTGDSGAAIQAVQTELPVLLPVDGGKARFGRIDVTTP